MFFPKDSLVYQMTLLIEIIHWLFNNKYSVPMYVCVQNREGFPVAFFAALEECK